MTDQEGEKFGYIATDNEIGTDNANSASVVPRNFDFDYYSCTLTQLKPRTRYVVRLRYFERIPNARSSTTTSPRSPNKNCSNSGKQKIAPSEAGYTSDSGASEGLATVSKTYLELGYILTASLPYAGVKAVNEISAILTWGRYYTLQPLSAFDPAMIGNRSSKQSQKNHDMAHTSACPIEPLVYLGLGQAFLHDINGAEPYCVELFCTPHEKNTSSCFPAKRTCSPIASHIAQKWRSRADYARTLPSPSNTPKNNAMSPSHIQPKVEGHLGQKSSPRDDAITESPSLYLIKESRLVDASGRAPKDIISTFRGDNPEYAWDFFHAPPFSFIATICSHQETEGANGGGIMEQKRSLSQGSEDESSNQCHRDTSKSRNSDCNSGICATTVKVQRVQHDRLPVAPMANVTEKVSQKKFITSKIKKACINSNERIFPTVDHRQDHSSLKGVDILLPSSGDSLSQPLQAVTIGRSSQGNYRHPSLTVIAPPGFPEQQQSTLSGVSENIVMQISFVNTQQYLELFLLPVEEIQAAAVQDNIAINSQHKATVPSLNSDACLQAISQRLFHLIIEPYVDALLLSQLAPLLHHRGRDSHTQTTYNREINFQSTAEPFLGKNSKHSNNLDKENIDNGLSGPADTVLHTEVNEEVTRAAMITRCCDEVTSQHSSFLRQLQSALMKYEIFHFLDARQKNSQILAVGVGVRNGQKHSQAAASSLAEKKTKVLSDSALDEFAVSSKSHSFLAVSATSEIEPSGTAPPPTLCLSESITTFNTHPGVAGFAVHVLRLKEQLIAELKYYYTAMGVTEDGSSITQGKSCKSFDRMLHPSPTSKPENISAKPSRSLSPQISPNAAFTSSSRTFVRQVVQESYCCYDVSFEEAMCNEKIGSMTAESDDATPQNRADIKAPCSHIIKQNETLITSLLPETQYAVICRGTTTPHTERFLIGHRKKYGRTFMGNQYSSSQQQTSAASKQKNHGSSIGAQTLPLDTFLRACVARHCYMSAATVAAIMEAKAVEDDSSNQNYADRIALARGTTGKDQSAYRGRPILSSYSTKSKKKSASFSITSERERNISAYYKHPENSVAGPWAPLTFFTTNRNSTLSVESIGSDFVNMTLRPQKCLSSAKDKHFFRSGRESSCDQNKEVVTSPVVNETFLSLGSNAEHLGEPVVAAVVQHDVVATLQPIAYELRVVPLSEGDALVAYNHDLSNCREKNESSASNSMSFQQTLSPLCLVERNTNQQHLHDVVKHATRLARSGKGERDRCRRELESITTTSLKSVPNVSCGEERVIQGEPNAEIETKAGRLRDLYRSRNVLIPASSDYALLYPYCDTENFFREFASMLLPTDIADTNRNPDLVGVLRNFLTLLRQSSPHKSESSVPSQAGIGPKASSHEGAARNEMSLLQDILQSTLIALWLCECNDHSLRRGAKNENASKQPAKATDAQQKIPAQMSHLLSAPSPWPADVKVNISDSAGLSSSSHKSATPSLINIIDSDSSVYDSLHQMLINQKDKIETKFAITDKQKECDAPHLLPFSAPSDFPADYAFDLRGYLEFFNQRYMKRDTLLSAGCLLPGQPYLLQCRPRYGINSVALADISSPPQQLIGQCNAFSQIHVHFVRQLFLMIFSEHRRRNGSEKFSGETVNVNHHDEDEKEEEVLATLNAAHNDVRYSHHGICSRNQFSPYFWGAWSSPITVMTEKCPQMKVLRTEQNTATFILDHRNIRATCQASPRSMRPSDCKPCFPQIAIDLTDTLFLTKRYTAFRDHLQFASCNTSAKIHSVEAPVQSTPMVLTAAEHEGQGQICCENSKLQSRGPNFFSNRRARANSTSYSKNEQHCSTSSHNSETDTLPATMTASLNDSHSPPHEAAVLPFITTWICDHLLSTYPAAHPNFNPYSLAHMYYNDDPHFDSRQNSMRTRWGLPCGSASRREVSADSSIATPMRGLQTQSRDHQKISSWSQNGTVTLRILAPAPAPLRPHRVYGCCVRKIGVGSNCRSNPSHFWDPPVIPPKFLVNTDVSLPSPNQHFFIHRLHRDCRYTVALREYVNGIPYGSFFCYEQVQKNGSSTEQNDFAPGPQQSNPQRLPFVSVNKFVSADPENDFYASYWGPIVASFWTQPFPPVLTALTEYYKAPCQNYRTGNVYNQTNVTLQWGLPIEYSCGDYVGASNMATKLLTGCNIPPGFVFSIEAGYFLGAHTTHGSVSQSPSLVCAQNSTSDRSTAVEPLLLRDQIVCWKELCRTEESQCTIVLDKWILDVRQELQAIMEQHHQKLLSLHQEDLSIQQQSPQSPSLSVEKETTLDLPDLAEFSADFDLSGVAECDTDFKNNSSRCVPDSMGSDIKDCHQRIGSLSSPSSPVEMSVLKCNSATATGSAEERHIRAAVERLQQILIGLSHHKTRASLDNVRFRMRVAKRPGQLSPLSLSSLSSALPLPLGSDSQNTSGLIWGDYSNIVAWRTPAPPGRVKKLKLVALSDNAACISWEPPANSFPFPLNQRDNSQPRYDDNVNSGSCSSPRRHAQAVLRYHVYIDGSCDTRIDSASSLCARRNDGLTPPVVNVYDNQSSYASERLSRSSSPIRQRCVPGILSTFKLSLPRVDGVKGDQSGDYHRTNASKSNFQQYDDNTHLYYVGTCSGSTLNGTAAEGYNSCHHFFLENLAPNTSYKVYIQSFRSLGGDSPLGAALLFHTRPLPNKDFDNLRLRVAHEHAARLRRHQESLSVRTLASVSSDERDAGAVGLQPSSIWSWQKLQFIKRLNDAHDKHIGHHYHLHCQACEQLQKQKPAKKAGEKKTTRQRIAHAVVVKHPQKISAPGATENEKYFDDDKEKHVGKNGRRGDAFCKQRQEHIDLCDNECRESYRSQSVFLPRLAKLQSLHPSNRKCTGSPQASHLPEIREKLIHGRSVLSLSTFNTNTMRTNTTHTMTQLPASTKRFDKNDDSTGDHDGRRDESSIVSSCGSMRRSYHSKVRRAAAKLVFISRFLESETLRWAAHPLFPCITAAACTDYKSVQPQQCIYDHSTSELQNGDVRQKNIYLSDPSVWITVLFSPFISMLAPDDPGSSLYNASASHSQAAHNKTPATLIYTSLFRSSNIGATKLSRHQPAALMRMIQHYFTYTSPLLQQQCGLAVSSQTPQNLWQRASLSGSVRQNNQILPLIKMIMQQRLCVELSHLWDSKGRYGNDGSELDNCSQLQSVIVHGLFHHIQRSLLCWYHGNEQMNNVRYNILGVNVGSWIFSAQNEYAVSMRKSTANLDTFNAYLYGRVTPQASFGDPHHVVSRLSLPGLVDRKTSKIMSSAQFQAKTSNELGSGIALSPSQASQHHFHQLRVSPSGKHLGVNSTIHSVPSLIFEQNQMPSTTIPTNGGTSNKQMSTEEVRQPDLIEPADLAIEDELNRCENEGSEPKNRFSAQTMKITCSYRLSKKNPTQAAAEELQCEGHSNSSIPDRSADEHALMEAAVTQTPMQSDIKTSPSLLDTFYQA